MLIEMHCHSAEHSSCSSVSAIDLVRQVYAKGLQGVALTDHHYLWPFEELAELRLNSGVPDHFLIMSGQETFSDEFGDVLIYGAPTIFERGTPLRDIRLQFPAAAIVWAHPYRKGRKPSKDKLCSGYLDGVEIFNSNHTVRGNSLGLQDWHRYRFTAISGTDTHGQGYAGLYPTHFDHPVSSVEELAREIRNGRCRPFLKEIPRSGANSQVTEVTIGTKGTDESRERIIIRELSDSVRWRTVERAFSIMGAISVQGFDKGTYRVPHPIDEDPVSMTLIEQGLRGKSLYEKLLSSTIDDGREYIQMTARWLAKLHRLSLRITSPDEFLLREKKRLDGYLARFTKIGHRHNGKVAEISSAVHEAEKRFYLGKTDTFVQGHGDFHPKNVIIGQDNLDNRTTLFVAAIDFESSMVMPQACDVGCFLAQFHQQFLQHSLMNNAFMDDTFLNAYLEAIGPTQDDFLHQVELFRARTNLSIAAYLIKLGLGESPDVWRLLVEAERALTLLQ